MLSALLTGPAWAWNPFSESNGLQEVVLTSGGMARLQVHAGWAKGDDQTLLFEVNNALKGPIQCSGVQVDLKDGKSLSKSLMPKLFVPPNNTRHASLPHVQKGTMKAYAIQCSCFKNAGRGECINPLRKN